MPIDNRRNCQEKTTGQIFAFQFLRSKQKKNHYTPHGLHPHLSCIGQTAGVCSLVQNMIQRQGAIRDNNVLTWREDGEVLICLCTSPPTAAKTQKIHKMLRKVEFCGAKMKKDLHMSKKSSTFVRFLCAEVRLRARRGTK
jgi:hypothetical protein